MALCEAKHRYNPAFYPLHFDQGGETRHLCAGCAAILGFQDALDGISPRDIKNDPLAKKFISASQAGSIRHKDAAIAYQFAYEAGQSFLKRISLIN